MLQKASRLLSIGYRLSQMVDMEQFRQHIVVQAYQRNQSVNICDADMDKSQSYNLIHFEKKPAFKLSDETKRNDIKFLQKRTKKRLKPYYANKDNGDAIYTIRYSDSNKPSESESSDDEPNFGLGLLHPIPIIGQRKHFLPPKMLDVSDTMAAASQYRIIEESNEDKACAKIDEHVAEKAKRSWKLATAHEGGPIGTIDEFKKNKMFRKNYTFGGHDLNHKRDIGIADQTRTLEKWQIRINVKAKHGLDKIDCLEENEIKRMETFPAHPAYIDWAPIIEATQNSILKLTEREFIKESREKYYQLTIQDAVTKIVKNPKTINHIASLYNSYLPSNIEMDIQTQFKEEVKDAEKYLKKLISKNTDDQSSLFLDEQVMGPSPALLLRCFTQKSAGENQHHKNVQRMEFIGDSFLKLATTRVLFDDDTISTAGLLTKERTKYIKNDNLRTISRFLELENYMNIASVMNQDALIYPFFIPYIFQWDLSKYKSKPSTEIKTFEWLDGHPLQRIDDLKWVADTVESLIGAYLVTGGEKMAAEFLLVLNKIYQSNTSVNTEHDYLVCPEPGMWRDEDSKLRSCHIYKREFLSDLEPNSAEQENIKQVEESLQEQLNLKPDFKFEDINLAKQALSMAGYHKYDNERLEFLGDAVIDYVIAFEYYNNLTEYIRRNTKKGPVVFEEGYLTAAKQAITRYI